MSETRYRTKYCCFPGCSTTSFEGGTSLFRFPKDIERCSKWKQFVGDDRYQNYTSEECYHRLRLCNLHFHSSSFPIFSKNRLKRNAVPRLCNDMMDASATDKDNSLPSTSAIAFTEDLSELEQSSTSSSTLLYCANSVEAVYVKNEVDSSEADVPEAPLNFDNVQELGIPTVFPARRNIEQICILCGLSNQSRKSNSVIIHFAELIRNFSGVDILTYNCPATACATCFKIVLELWNFKQQIIDSVKFVKQKFADQKNQTENATNFEYVECKIKTEEQEVINDCALEPGGNEKVIKLVPIENLAKDNKTKGNCFKCTKCGNSIPGRYIKFHDCTQAGTTQNYICPVCGRWYSNYKTLKRHEVTHKAKKHTCKICGDAFYNDFSLIQHTRKHTLARAHAACDADVDSTDKL